MGASTSPSNSRSSLGSPYYLRISNALLSPAVSSLPLEVFRFPLTLFFCFQIAAPRMPACLADAEPETAHHLLAGKPYPPPPTPPCFPFPPPESPRPRETTEVETRGGNQNGSALLCKLQPETLLSVATSPWLRGDGVTRGQRTRSRLLHEEPRYLINRVPGAIGSPRLAGSWPSTHGTRVRARA